MKDGQWSWNYPNKDWWYHDSFDTKDEAVCDAIENYGVDNEQICVGQLQTQPLPISIDADALFENLNEQYGEDLSEYDDNLFDSVTVEQQEELETELAEVMQKFYEKVGIKSTRFTVYNVETITVGESTQ